MGKSYKTSKHPNKMHILQKKKYVIKINILKLSSNKKIGQFCILEAENS
jgi:hypothetical protein